MAAIDGPVAGTHGREASRGFTGVLHEWVATVDHKKLGIMYIAAGIVFFVVAGLQAAVMRYQLAFPENDAISPEVFNRLFTMHGTPWSSWWACRSSSASGTT
jgi:cytochrome c oxidase subunit 1